MKKVNDQTYDGLSKTTLADIQSSLASHFDTFYSWEIKKGHIAEALFLLFEESGKLEDFVDVLFIHIEYDDALKLLSDFNFNILQNKIETDEEIIPDNFLMKFKIRIKSKGLIWIIHRNDLDPYSSNPHAHQISNNIKLDLSNGKCYKKGNHIHTIKRKELISFREEASKKFKGELPELKM
jgi:hypothetical protein